MRLLVLVSLIALLVFPIAANACDRNPGISAAELSVTRSALAVAHIGAKPKAKPKKHAVRAAAGHGY
jgi:hypothetical protein